ncbi:MAG: hypothetical protein P8183_06555 [Anaerolineae bacterium]|jgi:hypothetical protein
MNILKESYLNEYRRQEQLANLEQKRQINEALTGTRRTRHILTQTGHILHILSHVRKIRIEVHFDYNEPQPKATGC